MISESLSRGSRGNTRLCRGLAAVVGEEASVFHHASQSAWNSSVWTDHGRALLGGVDTGLGSDVIQDVSGRAEIEGVVHVPVGEVEESLGRPWGQHHVLCRWGRSTRVPSRALPVRRPANRRTHRLTEAHVQVGGVGCCRLLLNENSRRRVRIGRLQLQALFQPTFFDPTRARLAKRQVTSASPPSRVPAWKTPPPSSVDPTPLGGGEPAGEEARVTKNPILVLDIVFLAPASRHQRKRGRGAGVTNGNRGHYERVRR